MVSKALNPPPSLANTTSPERKWKGVRKRAWGRYVCEIRLPRSRQRIWLGSYATAEEAACAYDAASLCLRGTTASLNFPSFILSPVWLRDPPSSELPMYSREAIQSIAAAAAARCRNSDKLPCMCTERPLSSDISRAQQSPRVHAGMPSLSGLGTQSWTKSQVDLDQREDVKEGQVPMSSMPVQQHWSSSDDARAPSTAAEDEQCDFSILKELVPLPGISTAYGAPICY